MLEGAIDVEAVLGTGVAARSCSDVDGQSNRANYEHQTAFDLNPWCLKRRSDGLPDYPPGDNPQAQGIEGAASTSVR